MSTKKRLKNELYYGYNSLGSEVHEHTDKAARVAVRLSERIDKRLTEHRAKSHEYVDGRKKEFVARVKNFGGRILNPFAEVVVGEKKGKKKKTARKKKR
jgi:hypothetical protein